MASIINTSVWSFTTEEIRDLNELIIADVLKAPDLEVLHKIYPDIITGKFIGILLEGGPVGVAGQGCEPIPQDWKIDGVQKQWDPKNWEVFLRECWADLENSMAIYAMNKGVDIGDLTNTDYLSLVLDRLSIAIRKMFWRIIWFNDVDAAHWSDNPSGVITDSIDLKFMTIIDGLWKQLQIIAPVGDPQRVEIPANAQATYALQTSNMTGQAAVDCLSEMQGKASVVLRGMSGLFYAVTQSIWDAYASYLEGKELETTLANTINGLDALRFRGLNVIAFPIWDELINVYENSGTRWNNPHRALLTVKENNAVGVGKTSSFDEIKTWYDNTTDYTYMRARDKIDAKIIQDDLFILGM